MTSMNEASPRGAARARSSHGSHPRVLALAGVLLFMLALAFLGPLVAGDGRRTVAPSFAPPTVELPLGTDVLGRDVLARLLSGGSGLLAVAALATVVAVCAGTILGFATAHRDVVSTTLNWILDVVLVVPAMLTMLVLIFGLGAGPVTIVAITSAISAPFVARYVRSLARPLLAADFVLAARAGGDSWGRVFVREIAPVAFGPIAADAGARFVGAVYLVASASFLGFDPLGSESDWASMVQEGLQGISLNPWAALAPAIAIAAVTIPANLLVDLSMHRRAS